MSVGNPLGATPTRQVVILTEYLPPRIGGIEVLVSSVVKSLAGLRQEVKILSVV